MKNWYLLNCQIQRFDRVFQRVSSFGVECYYPVETRITPRKNRPSPHVRQKALLAGYLFVHIDPEIIHPTTLTDIPGAHYFVRFGAAACVIQPEIIAALKCVRMLRLDPHSEGVECMNLSPSMISKIQKIYGLPALERQVEFIKLLEHPDSLAALLTERSRIYSSLTPVPSR